MKKYFLRSILIFCFFLALIIAGLSVLAVFGARSIDTAEQQVALSHKVIGESQALAVNVKSMLAAQRGFLLTRDESFNKEYKETKNRVSENIALLKELTADNLSQVGRIDELQYNFLKFAEMLEATSEQFENKELVKASPEQVAELRQIDNLKEELARINGNVLDEEYEVLDNSIHAVERERVHYLLAFLVGSGVAAITLLVLNIFLLRAVAMRNAAQRSLRDTEDRLRIALEGTNDGIFDWNILTDEISFSDQYWLMLGYRPDEFAGTYATAFGLVHPDDKERLRTHIDNYLSGLASEYSIAFRMKHASGRWVWINSRGKAVYDDNGRPVRLVGAHTDINHIKAYEERLKEAKEHAEKANDAKTEFLAHMSHEIRTPLTAISGIAELLESSIEKFEPRQQKLVRTLSASTESLRDLINDILDFSKIESGEVDLVNESFMLADFFAQIISIMAVKANEKELEFKVDYSEVGGIRYYGDKVRLRQIIMNLIGNAIKFTSDGYVHVRACRAEWNASLALRIDIEDTGIGIEEQNIKVIFENFRQGDSSISRRFGGTGLGLPISQKLVDLMEGTILVNSEPGKGSVFTVILPIPEKSEEIFTEVTQDEADEMSGRIGGESRILLAEDYEGNVIMLTYIFEAMGCAYDVAGSGAEAVEMWQKRPYDVILMDIQMPGLDGFAATQKIRELEKKKKGRNHTPIIGMTAHALAGDKDRCLAAGMDDYLPKPLVEADLKEKLYHYLTKASEAACPRRMLAVVCM